MTANPALWKILHKEESYTKYEISEKTNLNRRQTSKWELWKNKMLLTQEKEKKNSKMEEKV